MWRDFCILILIIGLDQADFLEENYTGCFLEPACLKCGPPGCIKCLGLIMYTSRKCVNACPYGHKSRWSTLVDYMGRMCVHNGNFIGISLNTASTLTGIVAGTVLSIIIVILAVIYIQLKKKNCPLVVADTISDIDDSSERKAFETQLNVLRPHSNTFLEMLNDTRRQLRCLHQEGDNTAASAYKPIVRDLAKILLLLNKPADKLAAPDDWEHLFSWAQKVLKRYKHMSEISQAQVAQLVNFLQSPVPVGHNDKDVFQYNTSLTTFKPERNFGSSFALRVNNCKIKYENCDEDNFSSPLNPQWQFNYPIVANKQLSASQFLPGQLRGGNKEFLNNTYYLDDDFYQYGLRPQDEITTEL